jgi:hypothetical protein
VRSAPTLRVVRRATTAVAAVLVSCSVAAGCGDDGPIDASPTAAPSGHAIATFEVAGSETFKVELASPQLVDHARRLLAGDNVSAIPIGTVVRGDPGPNAPWSWHVDPATLEFADMTIGVCDGFPSLVEAGTVTSDQYCPWSAKIVAVEPL